MFWVLFVLTEVTQSVRIPVLIGSGVTHDNVEQYIQASAMIIGSHFKKGGHWANGVDAERIKRFMGKMHTLREWLLWLKWQKKIRAIVKIQYLFFTFEKVWSYIYIHEDKKATPKRHLNIQSQIITVNHNISLCHVSNIKIQFHFNTWWKNALPCTVQSSTLNCFQTMFFFPSFV